MARPRKPPSQEAEGRDLPRIEFGRVAGSYGVRGWIKVLVDEPEVLAAAPHWWLEGRAFEVEDTKPHSGSLLAKLAGIDSPEAAQAFKGKAVVIPRPAAGEGRYYWSDLLGLEVVNVQGVALGEVTQMSSNGAHDVMEVSEKQAAGKRVRLLPFVPAYVLGVDLQARRISVDWQADW